MTETTKTELVDLRTSFGSVGARRVFGAAERSGRCSRDWILPDAQLLTAREMPGEEE